jgi:hypothetical protein
LVVECHEPAEAEDRSDIAGSGVVGVAVGEGAVDEVVTVGQRFVGANRVPVQAGRVAKRDELAQALERRDTGVWHGDPVVSQRRPAEAEAEHREDLQAVDRHGREGDETAPRQRKEGRVGRRVAGERVIDDQQVEAFGEPFDRDVGKLLQRALPPSDHDAGAQFREPLASGNQRDVAPTVVPGDPRQECAGRHGSLLLKRGAAG